jgi:hypothetical protein
LTIITYLIYKTRCFDKLCYWYYNIDLADLDEPRLESDLCSADIADPVAVVPDVPENDFFMLSSFTAFGKGKALNVTTCPSASFVVER